MLSLAFSNVKGEQAMISEEARERMRRAYYLEKKPLRQIAREEGFSRVTIKRAISDASPRTYTMTKPRPAIVLGPYQLRVEELLAEQVLFELCSELHERVSVIITTNVRFADWNSIFADEVMTTSLLDRLTSKGHNLEVVGESYRFRQRAQMEEQAASAQAR